MSPRPTVICNMVYKFWDIIAALESMSSWQAVVCNIMYNVWDITTARETLSPWPAVIRNLLYKLYDVTALPENLVSMANGDMQHGLQGVGYHRSH